MQDFELFDGKTLGDLFKDVYTNQVSHKTELSDVVRTISRMIVRPEDAAILGPVLQQFMDTSIKNDENLIKMLNIAQRLISATTKTNDSGVMLSEAEKEAIIANAKDEIDAIIKESNQITKITKKITEPKSNESKSKDSEIDDIFK